MGTFKSRDTFSNSDLYQKAPKISSRLFGILLCAAFLVLTTTLYRVNCKSGGTSDLCHGIFREHIVEKEPQPQKWPLVRQMDSLPPSSIWCSGSQSRICQVQNLCYLPKRREYVVIKTHVSRRHGMDWEQGVGLVDLSSIDGHPQFVFDYIEINPLLPQFRNLSVRYITTPAFILSRFHPTNIMHSVHDDAIGLFDVLREFSYGDDSDEDQPFSKNNLLYFADGHAAGSNAHLFEFFTSNEIMYRKDLDKDPDTVTCFKRAVVGNSKRLNWYHYGFGENQGPIQNKPINGYHIRDYTEFVYRQAGFTSDLSVLPPSSVHFSPVRLNAILHNSGVTSPDQDLIVIFSRLRNRLILNENAISEALRHTYNLPVVYIRMEELTFLEQLAILRRTRLAIGMHGSILIMAMFMPRGAALIELYPYAVPPDNYTPYKTMAALPGIDLVYAAWQNTHPERSIPHPDWPAWEGGLAHLPPLERATVMESTTVPPHLCCSDPYWLYRIYQDTIVHVDELLEIVADAVSKSHAIQASTLSTDVYIEPGVVDAESVVCEFSGGGRLKLSWSPPWNNDIATHEYSVWAHDSQAEIVTNETWHVFEVDEGRVSFFWVRTSRGEWRGRYSEPIRCIPEGVVDDGSQF